MASHDPPARRPGATLVDRTDPASEQELAAYWKDYVDGGRRGARHVLSHWRRSWAALRAVRRLPRLQATPSDSPGGRAVRAVLAARASYGIPGRLLGTAVLEVPPDPETYLRGRRAQTLRRKIRSAERRGLAGPPGRGRGRAPGPGRRPPTKPRSTTSTRPTGSRSRTTTTCSTTTSGSPWTTPTAGRCSWRSRLATASSRRCATSAPWARATRTAMPATSPAARWSTELSRHGVRYLVDTATPPEQTNGLRHFQRMVGFRYARVRLR